MARTLSPDEHARVWAGLTFQERRRILKEVGRGRAMDKRKDARVAVGAARQQQRYWRRAWLIGLLIGLVFAPNWVQVAVNSALGAVLMGALSVYRYRKAVDAEEANLARLGIHRRSGD